MSARRKSLKSGFTLVEVIVTVAIIATLLALSFPIIQIGIQRAQNSTCMSNQEQIYNALQQLAADNNGQLPVMLPMRASVTDSGPTLDTALASYITDPSVFHCPADKTLFAQSGCSYLWVYGYSVNAQGQQNTSLINPSFPLFKQSNASQIPFVSDKEAFHPAGGSHVLYADGHVQ